MSDAKLYRQGGNVFVADLDVIEAYSASFQGRTLRQRSHLSQAGTWDEHIVPRTGESERGTLSIVFVDTTAQGTPAVRSYAAYQSLFLGVVHYIGQVDPDADVPALAGGALAFTATRVRHEQIVDDTDRDSWRVHIDWERVHP